MANLVNGSSGEEVRKLQQSLINAGYDLGAGGADGIFGNATQKAVQQYQMNNGLQVDGVAGDDLLNHLYSGAGNSPNTGQTGTAAPAEPIKPTTPQKYDPSADAAYQQALQVLQAAQQNAPTYTNSYDDQLKDLYEQIVNRDKFQFDLNADMLYKQYAQQYINNGQMAMMDTMGEAAGLTGGYGSSYSQGVGQQTYDAYLQQLNNIIPDLYDRAYQRYQGEGDELMQQYAMLGEMRDNEYNQFRDEYSRWLTERDYAQGLADQAYDRGYSDWQKQFGIQGDNRSYLINLITSAGYNPTDDEIAGAGMTREQVNILLQQYIDAHTPATGGGGSGGGNGGTKTPANDIPDDATIANKTGTRSDGSISSVNVGGYRVGIQELEKLVNSGDVKETYDKNKNQVLYTLTEQGRRTLSGK